MNEFIDIIETALDEPLWQCLVGWFLYFSSLCWIETKGKPLTINQWAGDNWLQLIIGLIVCFVMVAKDDDIMEEYFNAGAVFPWWMYFTSGFWVNVVFQIVGLVPLSAKYFVKKFNPIQK